MTASKYDAHTEPLFKQSNMMKLEDSFSIQCLKFHYEFKGNSLPKYFENIYNQLVMPTFMAQGTIAF